MHGSVRLKWALLLFIPLSCTVVVKDVYQYGLSEPIPINQGRIIKIDTVIDGPMGTVRNVTIEKRVKRNEQP